MFVQKTTSRRGKKVYRSYLVRESFRTAKGPRSRTVCNITGLEEDVREVIAQALRGRTLVPTDELAMSGAFDYGGLAVLVDAWDRYGLDVVLDRVGTPRQRALLKAMVLGRLLFPSSKLALSEQAEGTLLASPNASANKERVGEEENRNARFYWLECVLSQTQPPTERGISSEQEDRSKLPKNHSQPQGQNRASVGSARIFGPAPSDVGGWKYPVRNG